MSNQHSSSYYPSGLNCQQLALPKYDIVNQCWLPPSKETIYRRTLFQSMYGNPAIDGHKGLHCIYIPSIEWESPSIPGRKANEEEVQQIVAFYLQRYCEENQLDLVATGGRKHGIFLVAPTGTFRKDIYFPQMTGKWITHFSILFSELNSIQELDDVTVLILDDEKPGVANKYGLADCQGFISADMAACLGVATDVQIQHRIAVKDQWIAKGTVIPMAGDIVYNKKKIDILLPLSSFKGAHPPVGKVLSFDNLFFGIAFYGAREGKQYNNYKGSHSFFRWYTSNETKEWLGEKAQKELEKVSKLRSNPSQIAKKYLDSLGIDELDNIANMTVSEAGDIELNSAYKWAQVLASDSKNLLAQHPYVVQLVEQKMIPSLLSRIAQGSFIRLAGLMAANLPGLVGNVAISNAVETGRYILRRYPNRIWSDELLVDVINPHDFSKWTDILNTWIFDLSQYHSYLRCQMNILSWYVKWFDYIWFRFYALVGYLDDNLLNQPYWERHQYPDYLRGTILTSVDLSSSLGSDFDGDVLTLQPITEGNSIVPLVAEIESWDKTSPIVKADKNKLTGTVYQIAARSLNDCVGLISYYITCAQVLAMKTHTLTGGTQFPLIERLAQELETEVNSLKYNARADRTLLDLCAKWISDAKRIDEYSTVPIWTDYYNGDKRTGEPVNFLSLPVFEGQDAVTYLFNLVADTWITYYAENEDSLVPLPYIDYQYLSHSFIPREQWLGQEAENLSRIYGRGMQQILSSNLSESQRSLAIRDLFTEMDGLVNGTLIPWLKSKSSYRWKDYLLQIAATFWFLRHAPSNPDYGIESDDYKTNSICFRLFPQQIMQMLVAASK